MGTTLRNERGSAVIIAVLAMLVMGVLSISFALLADIESRVGVSYKQQAQAEALAEGALEQARDVVRTAPSETGGFTKWFNPPFNHTLFAAQALNGGSYWARIDNDCAAVNTVPAAIQEPNHNPGNQACDNATDYNEVAVLTTWAVSGSGRSRLRAIVGVDNPWRHVCSNAKPDNNGYCNEPGNRNGSPTVQPADPNDPNGPQAYNYLPLPLLGCSRIDPLVHGATLATCGVYNAIYPAPYPTGAGVPRFVLMGEDPATTATAKKCNADPANPAIYYFGYFDCALSSYCVDATDNCGSGGDRKGCLNALDSRVKLPAGPTYDGPPTGHYVPAPCGLVNHGMVFSGNTNIGNTGTQAKRFTVYAYNGTLDVNNNRTVYGTLVAEGNEVNNPCSDKDFRLGNGAASAMWTGPNTTPPGLGWGPDQYGYPLALVVYNPDLPVPTIQPTYAPQGTCADLGSNNSEVHGMIYSGGHLEFNPLTLDGTAVAFEIQTQGTATYTYNSTYGNNTPPPGFPFGSGNQVVIIRKSFVVCVNYSDDSGGPTGCN